ncbi:zinc-binding alcohol dehydrogenase/oxidoreductase [Streptoalloteichus tenebrarius]|uniref:Zinc-binding alcohol dehydrogenase/oxidoreductase n=1 Tax=Streptoalloteichus tenebrarius (strain ATCC 17920 / DSM 40477 / JCM 4838 / CBS 697.72 / NBRC 16177 / NCIMB 11028 / NRRL B-12390 / A12253. 1 / ISP 5477) TaxID=1933 RepID=A0ABT1I1X0_STRSD|nr:zinc-binding dehydrogenase [Streptoalloteichus tenebrarius]MCP2261782.1 zinc-binding alcohol dehydrogenase/oxidoreductase [Streptoalloteichus tenebrarius]BFF00839.1 zinc-binding dehydrogenase [Streptoalloteichus tenebrarius]
MAETDRSTMTAVVHEGREGLDGVRVDAVPVPAVGEHDVLVELRAAALNHRDLFIVSARSEADSRLVLGSDGAGVVRAVGSAVRAVAVGDEVIVNPSLGWERADEAPAVPQVLGGPTDGTFAQFVTVPARNVAPRPSHLDWTEAAALPLVGLTAYRALFTRGGLRSGEHVLLPGIGSGVATFALLLAKAVGAEVTVTSRSEEKRRRALELGADAAVDSAGDWADRLSRPADLVVDSIGSATFESCLSALRAGGRLVTLGATTGADVRLSLRRFFLEQFSLLGTSMGSAEEFAAMLAMVDQHRLRPVVDRSYALADAPTALADLAEGRQFGKLVLTMA